jgi:hypothetical protein
MRWTREMARHPWPADMFVQGDEKGLVLNRKGNYTTAFFEAFPLEGFIRGEGATLAEAEDAAWDQFGAQVVCEAGTGHEFERRQYTNGAGLCKNCNAFKVGVFPELPPDPNREPPLIEELINMLIAETGRPT